MTLLSPSQPPIPRLFTYRSESEKGSERHWPNLPPIPLGWRLFGLFLFCLIPRLGMVFLNRTVCHDGYYYISIASAFRDGQWAGAFSYLNLNIYPLILLALNTLGLEWVLAGKLWSVLMAALVVLPMFGWIRRLFSDQVAWIACFLYSLQPELVEMSFEPTRDPTFWFFFSLCLYTTVRAVSEGKLRWFFANGIVLTLAIHTRSEGWLLFIPLGLWVVRQLIVNPDCRKRLVAGTTLCLAVLPGIILLINLTILREETEWQFGRLNHFAMGWNWLKETVDLSEPPEEPWSPNSSSGQPQPSPESSPPAVAEKSAPTKSEAGDAEAAEPRPAPAVFVPTAIPEEPPNLPRYLKELASAFEQINLGLLVLGLYWSGREVLDWNRGVLFVLACALGVGVWIVYNHHGHLNGRYFFPIYLALIPFCGLGFLWVFYGFWQGAERLSWSWLKPEYTVIFLIASSIGLNWADAWTTNHSLREDEADFGEWLDRTHGPFRGVVTDSAAARAGYHAHDDVPTILQNWSTLRWQFPDRPRDLVILGYQSTPPEGRQAVIEAAKKWGLEPFAVPRSVRCYERFLVFVRSPDIEPPPSPTAQTQPDTVRQ